MLSEAENQAIGTYKSKSNNGGLLWGTILSVAAAGFLFSIFIIVNRESVDLAPINNPEPVTTKINVTNDKEFLDFIKFNATNDKEFSDSIKSLFSTETELFSDSTSIPNDKILIEEFESISEVSKLRTLINAINATNADTVLLDSLKNDLGSHTHFKALFDAVKVDFSKRPQLEAFFDSYLEYQYTFSKLSADLINEIKTAFDHLIDSKLGSNLVYNAWGKDFTKVIEFVALLSDAFTASTPYNEDVINALDRMKEKNRFIITNDPTERPAAEDSNSKIMRFVTVFKAYSTLQKVSSGSLSTSSAATAALARLATPLDAAVTAYVTDSITNIKTITAPEIEAAQEVVKMQLEFTPGVADRPAWFGKLVDLSEFRKEDAAAEPWRACEAYATALDNFNLLKTAIVELNKVTTKDNYPVFMSYLEAKMNHTKALQEQTSGPANITTINNLKKAIGILKIAQHYSHGSIKTCLASHSKSGQITGTTREDLIDNLSTKDDSSHVMLVHTYQNYVRAFNVVFGTKDSTVDKLAVKLNNPSTIEVLSTHYFSEFDHFIAYQAVKASMTSDKITFASKAMTVTGAATISGKMNAAAITIFDKFVADVGVILNRTTPTPAPTTSDELMAELNKNGSILKTLELNAKRFEKSEIESIAEIMHANGITADMLPK